MLLNASVNGPFLVLVDVQIFFHLVTIVRNKQLSENMEYLKNVILGYLEDNSVHEVAPLFLRSYFLDLVFSLLIRNYFL